MSETVAHQKPSPGHRRQGRNNGRAAAQKAYASESDMVALDPSRYNNSPKTPRKGNNYNNNNGGYNGSSQQRSQQNNSARQRNFASSGHESDQAPQTMTPQRPRSQDKAPSSMAFAGSTFHSSPAPDAIPMPSFLQKAAHSPLAKPSPARPIQQQPTPPATNDPEPPTWSKQETIRSTNDSPLNFMFEAHRREKQRQQPSSHGTTSSNNNSPAPSGVQQQVTSPPSARPTPARHHSSGGLDGNEFGDNYGQPTGPSFATPFNERLKAARPVQADPQHPHMAPHQSTQHQQYQRSQHQYAPQPQYEQHLAATQTQSVDPAEALKRMLFSGGKGQNQMGASAHPPQPARPTLSELGAAPAAPAHPPVSDGFNIHERFRQELRLDGQAPAPNAQRQLFSQ